MKLTLKRFLELSKGNSIQVCCKDGDKCAKYWTTLRGGISNIHTDDDLEREVYSIGVVFDEQTQHTISMVYIW